MKYFKYMLEGGEATDALQLIAGVLVQGGMDNQLAQEYANAFILIAGGEDLALLALSEASQQGAQPDLLALTIASTVDLAMQQLQGQVDPNQGMAYAKLGTKLQYIKQLRGKCPEGTELLYMKKGGVVCPKCLAKAKKTCGGRKLLEGDKLPKSVAEFQSKKCGGNVKRK